MENIYCYLLFSQIDGKIIKLMSGLGGAYCTMCGASAADGCDLAMISRGFKIDRDMNDVWDMWDYMSYTDKDGQVVIHKETGDYPLRAGLTQKPLTREPVTMVLPPEHAWLYTLSFLEDLIYRYL